MPWHIWRVSDGQSRLGIKPEEQLIVAESAIEAIRSIAGRAAGNQMVPHDAANGCLAAERLATIADINTVEGYVLEMSATVRCDYSKEVERLREHNNVLTQALRSVEYIPMMLGMGDSAFDTCPACHGRQVHKADCRIKRALEFKPPLSSS